MTNGMTVGKKNNSIYLKIAIILINIFGFVFLHIGMNEDISGVIIIGTFMILLSVPAMLFVIAGECDKTILEDEEIILKQENKEYKIEVK